MTQLYILIKMNSVQESSTVKPKLNAMQTLYVLNAEANTVNM